MKNAMKEAIRRIPIIGDFARRIYWRLRTFPGSDYYWEERYSTGGNSGVGSYGKFADFKAAIINQFVAEHDVRSVIEFGCGDGSQLTLAKYPTYLGFDVSGTAISKCEKLFASDASKGFRLMAQYKEERADVALSLDVIYHLVEDDVFERYMRALFDASDRYVMIYASDSDDNAVYEETPHIRHRKFTSWIRQHCPDWKLIQHIPNQYPYQGDHMQGSFADFFIYANTRQETAE